MIQAIELTKWYGAHAAVDRASFTAQPGRVTGFLGLNGSGKTTTLRMLLGLTRVSSGRALINGQPYRALRAPLTQVGAVIEQGVAHPGQTGWAHLRGQAMLAGANTARVEEVLDLVGLSDAATKRVGGYSLGMRQRLSIATALLGEPPVLILDEPANGLDPEGMAWMRGLLREHAAGGGTVLVSSHLLGELSLLVDDVVVIADGKIVSHGPLPDFTAGGEPRLRVRGRDPETLWTRLREAGAEVGTPDGETIEVLGLTAEEVGELAFAAGVPVYELTVDVPDLEDTFLRMVGAGR